MDHTTQVLTFNLINLESFSPKPMVIKKKTQVDTQMLLLI